jgi:hypothetical protein
MMHGFGFPLFMGGPLVWLILIIGGYFIIRRVVGSGSHAGSRVRESGSSHSPQLQGSIETKIYRLAAARNGTLTVSDVVTELEVDPERAESILESMSDGMRVRMEVTDNGMVYYSFPELKKRD